MSLDNDPDSGVQRPLLADSGETEYGTVDGVAVASSEQSERGTFTRNLGAIGQSNSIPKAMLFYTYKPRR